MSVIEKHGADTRRLQVETVAIRKMVFAEDTIVAVGARARAGPTAVPRSGPLLSPVALLATVSAMEHKQNIILGPRYQVRLEDLRDWHVLEIRCGRCSRTGRLYPSTLRRRWQGYMRLVELERHLVCRVCRNRDFNTWVVRKQDRNS